MSARRSGPLDRLGGPWPIVILAWSLASAGIALADWRSPLRAPFILSFLAICPGMALVRLLHLDDVAAELSLAIALSIALSAIVASVSLYSGAWSPPVALAVLIGISVAGGILQIVLARVPGRGDGSEREPR